MTAERPFMLNAAGPNGPALIQSRQFRCSLIDGWSINLHVHAYVHIPFSMMFSLENNAPREDWAGKPGPRLVFAGSSINAFSVEVLDLLTHVTSCAETSSQVVGLAAGGVEEQVTSPELIATLSNEDRIRICLQFIGSAHPRISVEGPRPFVPADESKGRAVLPTCRANSQHLLTVSFDEYEIDTPSRLPAEVPDS